MKRIWLICTNGFILMLVLAACSTTNDAVSKKEGEAYRRVGEAYLQQGNLASAMKELKKAEAKYPDDHLLQYDLGLIYYSRGRFDEAIGHYKKAVELNPDFGPAINSLGNSYAGKKDWDKAIFYYNQLIGNILYATPHFTYSLQRGTGAFRKILSRSLKDQARVCQCAAGPGPNLYCHGPHTGSGGKAGKSGPFSPGIAVASFSAGQSLSAGSGVSKGL
jgi:tetratricopeptide (TPR) repeat protein